LVGHVDELSCLNPNSSQPSEPIWLTWLRLQKTGCKACKIGNLRDTEQSLPAVFLAGDEPASEKQKEKLCDLCVLCGLKINAFSVADLASFAENWLQEL
jgi:hypothetical protein